MLVKTISFNDFLQEFEKFGRGNQFTYNGKKALYDYLNDLSEDTGDHIELDIISICCNFSEYNTVKEFNRDYGYILGEIEDIEDIRDFTTVIQVNEESFIIQNF